MEKLTLKEIAGYLPHKIELQYVDSITQRKRIAFLTSLGINEIETTYKRKIKSCSGDLISWEGHNSVHKMQVKPILYPLEMLTYTIVHNGVEIIPLVKYVESFGEPCDDFYEDNLTDFQIAVLAMLSNRDMRHQEDLEFLQEHHFDYQDLIKSGKAIDKSKL